MAHREWQERTFWDGTQAIFLKNHGGMSCYDLDSDELGGIIEGKIAECDREKTVWLELLNKREAFLDGKESNRQV